jgi:hypothetical protein
MAYLGWISGAVGVVVGFVGGTLTTFYASKYFFDKANEVKELIVTARRFISDSKIARQFTGNIRGKGFPGNGL